MLCLKLYLPREYSVVTAIKSSSALAHLSLEKESPMKYFSVEIVMPARSFWLSLYGHVQVFNCDQTALSNKPRYFGGCYCGEEGPNRTSLVVQMVKCLSTMRETWVQSLGWEDPLEKEMNQIPIEHQNQTIPCRLTDGETFQGQLVAQLPDRVISSG